MEKEWETERHEETRRNINKYIYFQWINRWHNKQLTGWLAEWEKKKIAIFYFWKKGKLNRIHTFENEHTCVTENIIRFLENPKKETERKENNVRSELARGDGCVLIDEQMIFFFQSKNNLWFCVARKRKRWIRYAKFAKSTIADSAAAAFQ